MDAPQHPSQSKDLVLEAALARCVSWGLAAPCPVHLPLWHGVPAEPTHPAHSLRPAQTGGLGKARKEPYDYSATNRSRLSVSSPPGSSGSSQDLPARVRSGSRSSEPRSGQLKGGTSRRWRQTMGAGTAASGPCQPLKDALWPACLEMFKLENVVALMHQQWVIFTNKDKLYESDSPKAELFYQL